MTEPYGIDELDATIRTLEAEVLAELDWQLDPMLEGRYLRELAAEARHGADS